MGKYFTRKSNKNHAWVGGPAVYVFGAVLPLFSKDYTYTDSLFPRAVVKYMAVLKTFNFCVTAAVKYNTLNISAVAKAALIYLKIEQSDTPFTPTLKYVLMLFN